MTTQNAITALAPHFPHVDTDRDGTRVWSDHEGFDQYGVAIEENGKITLLDCDGYPSNETPDLDGLLWMLNHHGDLGEVWAILNR